MIKLLLIRLIIKTQQNSSFKLFKLESEQKFVHIIFYIKLKLNKYYFVNMQL